MPKAIFNGTVIAESEATEVVEGNHYFPRDAVKREFLSESSTRTHCPWKGDARYYNITVGDTVNPDAAWSYPVTKDQAKHIEGYVAFWKGVEIET